MNTKVEEQFKMTHTSSSPEHKSKVYSGNETLGEDQLLKHFCSKQCYLGCMESSTPSLRKKGDRINNN